jgi:hypothetical protein
MPHLIGHNEHAHLWGHNEDVRLWGNTGHDHSEHVRGESKNKLQNTSILAKWEIIDLMVKMN